MNNRFRIGIWIGLAAAFYFLVHEVLSKHPMYAEWRWHVWKGLLAGSVLFLLAGRFFGGQREPDNGKISFNPKPAVVPIRPERVFSSRYCAFILTSFAVIVRLNEPHLEANVIANARTDADAKPPSMEQQNEPGATVPEHVAAARSEVRFPEMRVQGVVCSKSNPSALVNNKTLFVGDYFEGAKVLSILPNSIVMEKEGEKKVYVLRAPEASPGPKGR